MIKVIFEREGFLYEELGVFLSFFVFFCGDSLIF